MKSVSAKESIGLLLKTEFKFFLLIPRQFREISSPNLQIYFSCCQYYIHALVKYLNLQYLCPLRVLK